MKKGITFFVVVLMILSFTPSVTKAVEVDLSEIDIMKRFEAIDKNYEIGEVLSLEDQRFVFKYANGYSNQLPKKDLNREMQPMSFNTFTGKSTINGIEAAILGTHDLYNGWINNNYTISMTTAIGKNKSKVTKIKNEYEHYAFGLIGSGGIGKVYTKKDSTTCNSNTSCYSYFTNSYLASAALAYTNIKGTVYYSNGSFDVKIDNLQ